jgi:hypothetical protein
MFIRNCWYVAAWDNEMPGDGTLARTLLDEPVLFYRNTSGQVVALEDRCCHRGAPLHLGRKEGDCIRSRPALRLDRRLVTLSLDDELPHWDVSLITRRDPPLTPVARALATMLRGAAPRSAPL